MASGMLGITKVEATEIYRDIILVVFLLLKCLLHGNILMI